MSERTQNPRPDEADDSKICSKCSEANPSDHYRRGSRICRSCRRDYQREYYQREYGQKNREKARTPAPLVERPCRLCGTMFMPQHWKVRFCSDPCRRTWSGNRGNGRKRCRFCRQVKDLGTGFDRLSSSCRECVALFAEQLRRCNRCTEVKPWAEFPTREGSTDPTAVCKECSRARGRAYHTQDEVKRQRRARKFRERYGITVAEYEAMHDAQGGVCAICQEPSDKPLHVDHNHATGAVRALLCFYCNSVLGLCHEDVARLRSAIQYIERHTS